MSILSEILATKHTEVCFRSERVPLDELEKQIADAAPTRGFRKAIVRSPHHPALIAEVKKASPSKGVIRADFDPAEIAKTYSDNGAVCLSVLTDEQYFQGSLAYLRLIRELVSVPLLRKDFIVDAWQIAESLASGADAILLIVAALSPTDLRRFLQTAEYYGLDALVEVHDAVELGEALEAKATLIGINNRDLHTFRTSLETTFDLVKGLKPDPQRILVSESGIFTREDALKLDAAGVDAMLVGESLMREADIGAKQRALLGI